MRITRLDSAAVPGPSSAISGSAWVCGVARPEAPSRLVVEEVTFAPGSCTIWHSHPLGQLLLITGGCGWLQARGEAAVQVSAGDVVWLDAGEEHWHGSLPSTLLRHLSIQEHVDGVDAHLGCPLASGEYPPQSPANQPEETYAR